VVGVGAGGVGTVGVGPGSGVGCVTGAGGGGVIAAGRGWRVGASEGSSRANSWASAAALAGRLSAREARQVPSRRSTPSGTLRLVLNKKKALPGTPLEGLAYPLLETRDEWVVHGFSFPNYLAELGAKAQSEVFGKATLDLAMRDAFRKTRSFLMTTRGLSEDEAVSLMSVGIDFGVTQVVDGNWGVHAIIRKELFAARDD